MRHWLPLFLSREASAAPIFMSSKKLILLLVFLLLTISVSAKTEFYSNQEECEHKTGHICAFQMCDYVPEGKTFDEVCGRDFKKGWVPIGVPKLIVDPEDRICKIDTVPIVNRLTKTTRENIRKNLQTFANTIKPTVLITAQGHWPHVLINNVPLPSRIKTKNNSIHQFLLA